MLGNCIRPRESKGRENETYSYLRISSTMRSGPRSTAGKIVAIGASALVAALAVGLVLLHFYWPFSESEVQRELGEATSSVVTFKTFHDRYFPPGCLAEGVVFQETGSSMPLITVQRLSIRSNLFGLLHHHVSLIRAEGAHANWQHVGSNDSRSKLAVVDRLVADDAVLEIPRKTLEEPLRFVFHKLEVANLHGSGQSSFSAEFDNPLPHGLLRVSGHFGPWNDSRPAQTALDGNYSLQHADMGVFHSVAGFITSTGKFGGVFEQISVEGQGTIPELEVTRTHHGLPLEAHFSVLVNGPHGDVFLRNVKARFGRDDLEVRGSVAKGPDGKRVADLDLKCDSGRIEDTFYPFIHSPKPALTGKVRFQMHVIIPPGKEQFEKKIVLQSTFRIEDARFTHPQTQLGLSKIAEGPRQRDPDTAMPASFQGQVAVKDGIAQFSELDVHDQGAAAVLRGNYDLIDQRVNIHGRLKTEASLTKTTHGIKSVFAKAIEPFFKNKPHETVVPVKISGTYRHPQFGLDLSQKM